MLVLLSSWHELNEIKTNGQTFQEALYIFKGTAGPSISHTMENIMNVQIVQLDAETPIIDNGHPTSWASAPKQWSLKRKWGKSSETVGIWMSDHQWTEDNIQHSTGTGLMLSCKRGFVWRGCN